MITPDEKQVANFQARQPRNGIKAAHLFAACRAAARAGWGREAWDEFVENHLGEQRELKVLYRVSEEIMRDATLPEAHAEAIHNAILE